MKRGRSTAPKIGQRDGHRSGFKVKYTRGIQGIAIHPHDVLLVDRSHVPIVIQFSEFSGLEIKVSFSADELSDGNSYRIAAASWFGLRHLVSMPQGL